MSEQIFLSWVQFLHTCRVQIPHGYHWRFSLLPSVFGVFPLFYLAASNCPCTVSVILLSQLCVLHILYWTCSTTQWDSVVVVIVILNLFLSISYYVAVCFKSRSQQEIKAIYPITLQKIFAVLFSVFFCSCMAAFDLETFEGSDLTHS